ncbi:hypothetical protein AOC36_00255 [Erysipelothrix larvae]|uniref:Fatty acid-binding protein DegV n=1 Tax=Erysipelothrix larvae TaxID=1514105 RepID=A0A120JTC8_9FIRM|nr:DegV family protein [Erysipelothrix larvae]AMC92478.1 hypothetical protein AOC36_00255 [Erysipelothrix larvae]
MKKYGIVVDSSAALTEKQASDLGVVVAPLTLTYNKEHFEDQITMTYNDVKDILARHEIIMTSQPNIGRILELLEPMRDEGYDHIFIITLSATLSGTFSAFNHAVEELQLSNVSVIDSYTIAGPVQNAIGLIRHFEAKDGTVEEILEAFKPIFDNTSTYIYPQDFRQLKASGRISSSAATLASLLKIKPVLRFENRGKTIEKFATARTEAKAFDAIMNDLLDNGVNQNDHILYILEFEADEVSKRFINRVHETFPNIEIIRMPLPAAVATHAGIGTIAIQWNVKTKQ